MTANAGKIKSLVNAFINYGLLPIVYIIVLCFFIKVDWVGQAGGSYNRIINGGMILIITIVLVWAYWLKFLRVNNISKQLDNAAKIIKDEHGDRNEYLWERYKELDATHLFSDQDLIKSYSEFQAEKNRLERSYSSYHVCSIEKYLNQELIDLVMDRDLMLIIPGIMTGLGILGTFIGLTLGLQFFSTGTADEMMHSIPPLMEGIKIAFHTSIYGMTFSLIFNYVYKNVLESAYDSMDDFLDAFSQYVYPDSEEDGISKLIYSQQKQTEAVVDPIVTTVQSLNENMQMLVSIQKLQHEEIRKLPDVLGDSIGKRLEEVLMPLFENTNQSLENFTGRIGEIQISGMGNLVDQFISQMNDSLANRFTELSGVILQTSELQKQNNEYVEDLFIKIGELTHDLREINKLSNGIIESMSENVNTVKSFQGRMIQNFSQVTEILEKNRQTGEKQNEYMETLVAFQTKLGQVTEVFRDAMNRETEQIKKMEDELANHTLNSMKLVSVNAKDSTDSVAQATKSSLTEIIGITEVFKQRSNEDNERAKSLAAAQNTAIFEAAEKQIRTIQTLANDKTADMNQASRTLSETARQLNEQMQKSLVETFGLFDEELSTITGYLSKTISEIETTTSRVPKVVSSAYETMEQSFADMQKQMESMIHMLDIMQRNMPDALEKMLNDEIESSGEGKENGETTT